MDGRLIAYFSATGTTARAAGALAAVSGADLFAIEPAVPYTPADLDWKDERSRFTVEHRDRTARPQIAGRVGDMAAYDTVYLGFPIWGHREPRIVDTFLEQYDFDGKALVLFGTSGADGFGGALAHVQGVLAAASPAAVVDVRESAVLVGHPTTVYTEGRVVPGTLDDAELAAWIADLGF